MSNRVTYKSIPGLLAVVAVAYLFALPAAGQPAPAASPQETPPTTAQPAQPSPDINQQRPSNKSKEGFWGHLMPFARKKWVKRQTDPINDRLTELDQLSAKNAGDIRDADQRAQAGIQQAQSAADAASQAATAAGTQAQQASTTAQGASGHVDQLHTTVNGLDQYQPVSEVEVVFRGGQPVLSKDAKGQLDEVVTSLNGRKGYIVEIEGHNPAAGSAGIENSRRLANVVDRYLVEHDIPVYRVHMVALGNAPMATATGEDTEQKPVRKSSVSVRLMENSLAARDTASLPQDTASSTGAERP